MKSEVTIQLEGAAAPITIQSPKVVGVASLARLGRLLDGESPESVFSPADSMTLPTGNIPFGTGQRELIGILINDAPPGEPRRATRMFVTKWPLISQLFPGVVLERRDGRWLSYPGVYDDLTADTSIAFLIRERWVMVSHRFVELELTPLLQYAQDLTKTSHAKIGREVLSRCNLYSREGMAGFFAERLSYNFWQVAVHWHDWEERGTPVDERLGELSQLAPPVEMTPGYFRALCQRLELSITEVRPDDPPRPAQPPKPTEAEPKPIVQEPELMSLHRASRAKIFRRLSEFRDEDELETVAIGGTYPVVTNVATLIERELELVRNWDPKEDAVFSYGGPADLSYDVDPQIKPAFPSVGAQEMTLRTLGEELWWWKNVVNDFEGSLVGVAETPDEKAWRDGLLDTKWQQHSYDLFRDNWERSAFFYEFRARFQGRYAWEPFGKPWVKLNYTQRGILACMWPPTNVGQHRIQPTLHPMVVARMKSRVRLNFAADLNMPPAKLDALVERLLAERGITVPKRGKRGSGSPKMLPWRTLQYLDLQHYLQRKFPDNQTKLIATTQRYVEACKEFGIPP